MVNQTTANDTRRRALGRGLEALLPAKPAQASSPDPAPAKHDGSALQVPLDRIVRNPYQTRTRFDEAALEELARSVAATGVVQPVTLRALPDGNYQLIAGERRWLASQRAGKETVPAVVIEVSDEQAMEMTIVENLQRADLNPIEQARAFERLSREFHLTQEQMAQRTGKDRATVTNFMRLLRLPQAVQQRVEAGELSFGHARALLALETPEAIAAAAQKVVALSMSVRATETYVKGLLDPERKLGKAQSAEEFVDPNVREAQEQIQRAIGLRTRIEDKNGKGRVIIEYARLEDFDALMDALTRR